MPVIRPNVQDSGGEKRTTFRPPWVKEGPPPLPAPPPAWMGKQQPSQQGNAAPQQTNAPRPKLKEVKKNKSICGESSDKPPRVENRSKLEAETESATKQSQDIPLPVNKKKETQLDNRDKPEVKEKKVTMAEVANSSSIPPPPAPPAPPPPPPMSSPAGPPPGFEKKPLTKDKAMKIEALKSRPRRRPDWTDMMKEVESGIKLKHVPCNDRSAPILPKAKAKGQFVYDSEKQNAHNLLLREIQSGVSLKKVRTNDRSKPILQGLRKFRRQMTIEEQIQKSASVADVVAAAAEPDELDDIDKVRDDLQSTKQLLALELRNKEALERENKRLMARLLNLEVELEKEKAAPRTQSEGKARTEEDDKLIQHLKEEAAQAALVTKELEEKYHKTAEELDYTRAKLESAWLRNTQLEMELKSKGNQPFPMTRQPSNRNLVKTQSIVKCGPGLEIEVDEEEEEEETETETEGERTDDEDDSNMNEKERNANREIRELKLLTQKLRSFKEKHATATKEKKNLKGQLLKLQKMLKDEKKKYKLLQKEVDKMAKLMKDVDGDDEEEAEEEESEDEEETETESEEEEDDEEVIDNDTDAPEDAPIATKLENLGRRIKAYEGVVMRAKKGNYLLKVNIDRRQDDLNRQKDMSLSLQEDLNAVLTELG